VWPPGGGPSDVVVRLGTIPHPLSCDPIVEGEARLARIPSCSFPDRKSRLQLLLAVGGIANYLITGGTEILVEPEPGSEPDSVRLFLQSAALAALLHQRGNLPLHASGVATPRGAVLFAGCSGSGKSTIAAALHKRGFPLLADEIYSITGLFVHPSGSRALLWRESLLHLGEDGACLRAIRQGVEKFILPLDSGTRQSAAMPIYAVYVLESGAPLEVAPLEGLQKIAALWQHTYRLPFVRRMNLERQHLARLCELADQARIRRLVRPDAKFPLNELVEFVERELEER